jgi:ribonuclease BN (tRNA processing enzyme)
VDATRGADLLVCEAYFLDKAVRYHLDYATLLRERHRLECGRILLTHMSHDMLGRLGEVALECAHDGQVIEL